MKSQVKGTSGDYEIYKRAD